MNKIMDQLDKLIEESIYLENQKIMLEHLRSLYVDDKNGFNFRRIDILIRENRESLSSIEKRSEFLIQRALIL